MFFGYLLGWRAQRRRVARGAVGGAAILATLGCSSGPEGVTAPPIDPAAATAAAFEQYDKSADGQLDEHELAACPALQSALGNLDKDADRRVSRDELSARLASWVSSGIGVSFLTVQVTQRGRPLVDVEVRLVPEGFLGGAVQPAKGVTSTTGAALMAIDAANLPADLAKLRGVQQGYYRVEVTHPTVTLPAKYNSASTLGLEASFDAGRNFVTFSLD